MVFQSEHETQRPPTRWQSIVRQRVINRAPFGRELQKFARKAVGPFSEKAGFGFQDGGCFMFAAALRVWSREAMEWAAIYDPAWKPTQAQHVVVRLGRFFFDSDGMGTAEDLLLKFRHFERPVEVKLTEYDPDKEFVIPVQPAFVEELAARLQKAFGNFATDRVLEGIADDTCSLAPQVVSLPF